MSNAHTEDTSASRPQDDVVNVELSTGFQEALGPEKTQQFIDLVERLGQQRGDQVDAQQVREEFAAGLDRLGVDISEVEQERHVERILAGNTTRVHTDRDTDDTRHDRM